MQVMSHVLHKECKTGIKKHLCLQKNTVLVLGLGVGFFFLGWAFFFFSGFCFNNKDMVGKKNKEKKGNV